MKKGVKKIFFPLMVAILAISIFSCKSGEKAGKIKVGLSIASLQEERWQKDRDTFKAEAEALGAAVYVQGAHGDEALQITQCENLISQGVDVLVVVPQNGEAAAIIVDMAHEAGIPVIAYDRLIMNCDVDLYISFDNVKVGELQAAEIIKHAPKGKYVYIGGSPTDNNALLFREGAINILQPYMDSGDIELVYSQFTQEWNPAVAQRNMENALTKNNNKIDAVIAANDGTAGGCIQALAEQKLAGKVPISGQDADIAACMRVVEGKQTMTVYKSIKLIASESAKAAIAMAKKEDLGVNSKVNNNQIDVPSILLTPVAVTKDNMYDQVVLDGFHSLESVYKNVPQDQWPAK